MNSLFGITKQIGTPLPDKPIKIISGVVDKNANEYIDILEQENRRLNNILDELEQVIKNYKYTNTCHCYSCNKELCDILLEKIKELKGEDNGRRNKINN